jgi:hypothetical protein
MSEATSVLGSIGKIVGTALFGFLKTWLENRKLSKIS